jgi:hypothetical protein
MAEDFDRLLKEIDGEEKIKRKIGEDRVRDEITGEAAKASANYNDWLWHFEMLESQFKETHELFVRIQQSVTNWEISRDNYFFINSYSDPAIKELYYSTGISRNDLYNSERKATLTVSLPMMRDFREKKPGAISQARLRSEGSALLTMLKDSKETTAETERWITSLNKLNLEFNLYYRGYESPGASRAAGIGFLYDHNLADTCKEIFKMMNDDGIKCFDWRDQLKTLVPDGDYRLRRGNQISQLDDNIIVPKTDPNWRNE